MAYKNRKTNKRYIKELRIKEGSKARKSKREKLRNHPLHNLTIEEMEILMKQEGLI